MNVNQLLSDGFMTSLKRIKTVSIGEGPRQRDFVSSHFSEGVPLKHQIDTLRQCVVEDRDVDYVTYLRQIINFHNQNDGSIDVEVDEELKARRRGFRALVSKINNSRAASMEEF
jgi:hypothetical protein